MSGVTVAGSTSDPGPWSYQFSSPTALVVDQYGYMYILDYGNNRIQKWFPSATYGSTVLAASFYNPYGMSMDILNNLVVTDTYNHRVVSFGVVCRTFLCSRNRRLEATDQFLLRLSFSCINHYNSVTTKFVSSNLFFTSHVRRLSLPGSPTTPVCPTAVWNQTFTSLAGTSGSAGSSASLLYNPGDLNFDAYLNLYVADTTNHRIQFFPRG